MIANPPHFSKTSVQGSPETVETTPRSGRLRVHHATRENDALGEVARAFDSHEAMRKEYVRLENLLAHHQREVERLEVRTNEVAREKNATHDAVVEAILRADPRPFPTTDEWYSLSRPFWSVRLDGKLLALTKNPHEHTPDSVDDPQFKSLMTLVVIDLEDQTDGKATLPTPEARSIVREIVERAVRRFEESRETLARIRRLSDEVDPDGNTPNDVVDRAEIISDIDALQAEEALAYIVSAAFNELAPAHLQVEEESQKSIGIGVRLNGKSYVLRDVVGNMTAGIIGVVESDQVIDL